MASPSPSPSPSAFSLRFRPRPAAAEDEDASDPQSTAVAGQDQDKDKDQDQDKEKQKEKDDAEELHPAPACLSLGIALVFVAIVVYFSSDSPIKPKLWTKEELAKYNGSNEELPILLGILGSVFDVTKGRNHYGVGGGYNHFAGRDATRAFVSGNFTGDGLTDSVAGLSPMEMKSLVDWWTFYNTTYVYVGKLKGRFYDANGNATKELKMVHAKEKIGLKLLKQQEAEEQKYVNCNSRWSQQHGGEVWCDVGYPRLVEKVGELPLMGRAGVRCACFTKEELNGPGRLQAYEGCDPLASTCKVS